jgi:hypothetical protein
MLRPMPVTDHKFFSLIPAISGCISGFILCSHLVDLALLCSPQLRLSDLSPGLNLFSFKTRLLFADDSSSFNNF